MNEILFDLPKNYDGALDLERSTNICSLLYQNQRDRKIRMTITSMVINSIKPFEHISDLNLHKISGDGAHIYTYIYTENCVSCHGVRLDKVISRIYPTRFSNEVKFKLNIL